MTTRTPRRPWRLIFNWDSGGLFGLPWWQTDAAAFREQGIPPLLEMGADAVALGMSVSDVLHQDSEFGEYSGEHDDGFDHVRFWERRERVRRMIAQQRFQLTVLLEEGRRAGLDVLASFRMNDTHDCYYSPQNPLAGSPPARFKLDHPELMIRDDQAWGPYCLDFALAAVRDRRFGLIRETVERFDVDGVELDFMRNGFYFTKGTERRNAPLMTELVARVRTMLDEVGRSRGKTLQLAVHVPATQEVSLNCGLDTVAWIEQGLVNQVVADEGCVPFTVVPADFIAAARAAGGTVHVYSTADVSLGNPERPEEEKRCHSKGVPWSEAQLRGWAAYQTAGGVQGLNLFNGHNERDRQTLTAVFGKAECWETGFAAGDKAFVANNHSFTANMPAVAWPDLPRLPLPLTVGEPAAIAITIPSAALEAPGTTAALHLKFGQITVEDELAVTLNGRALATFGARDSAQAALAAEPDAPLAEAIGERVVPVPVDVLVPGENRVEVTLVHRNPWLRPPLKWKNAEVRLLEEGRGIPWALTS